MLVKTSTILSLTLTKLRFMGGLGNSAGQGQCNENLGWPLVSAELSKQMGINKDDIFIFIFRKRITIQRVGKNKWKTVLNQHVLASNVSTSPHTAMADLLRGTRESEAPMGLVTNKEWTSGGYITLPHFHQCETERSPEFLKFTACPLVICILPEGGSGGLERWSISVLTVPPTQTHPDYTCNSRTKTQSIDHSYNTWYRPL